MPKARNDINLSFFNFGLFLFIHSLNFYVMLKAFIIGNLGADAEVKNSNGRDFVTFRVAHSFNSTDSNGNSSENVVWVDCISSNVERLLPYLKRGTQVFVEGAVSLRVYSSKQDRCMKAGMTIHVDSVQLIGTKVDLVPKEVVNPADGSLHSVEKKYMVTDMIGVVEPDNYISMLDAKGNEYFLDTLGFIKPSPKKPEE